MLGRPSMVAGTARLPHSAALGAARVLQYMLCLAHLKQQMLNLL
jgi:hypothetical protein